MWVKTGRFTRESSPTSSLATRQSNDYPSSGAQFPESVLERSCIGGARAGLAALAGSTPVNLCATERRSVWLGSPPPAAASPRRCLCNRLTGPKSATPRAAPWGRRPLHPVLNHEPNYTMMVSNRCRTRARASELTNAVTAHERADQFGAAWPIDERKTRLFRARAAHVLPTFLLLRARRPIP
jgi:hypothetical protein